MGGYIQLALLSRRTEKSDRPLSHTVTDIRGPMIPAGAQGNLHAMRRRCLSSLCGGASLYSRGVLPRKQRQMESARLPTSSLMDARRLASCSHSTPPGTSFTITTPLYYVNAGRPPFLTLLLCSIPLPSPFLPRRRDHATPMDPRRSPHGVGIPHHRSRHSRQVPGRQHKHPGMAAA